MNTVILTEDEAKLVMQCLDIATKHGGLNAAAVILPVAASIETQLTAKDANKKAIAEQSAKTA